MSFIKHGRGQPLGIVEIPTTEACVPPEKQKQTKSEERKSAAAQKESNTAQHQEH